MLEFFKATNCFLTVKTVIVARFLPHALQPDVRKLQANCRVTVDFPFLDSGFLQDSCIPALYQ